MKKIIALLLALTIVFSFAACGGENTSEAPETAKFKAGFIFLHDENSTYDLNFLNATKEACEALGVEYVIKVNIPESEACYDAAAELVDEGCPTSLLTSSATSPTCSRQQRNSPMFSSATQPALRLTPPVLLTTTTLSLTSTKAVSWAVLQLA